MFLLYRYILRLKKQNVKIKVEDIITNWKNSNKKPHHADVVL